MACEYKSNGQFCKVGSKRRLTGHSRKTYLTSLVDHCIAPSELRKDAARRIMNSGNY